jgi:hypothetical protein
VINELRLWARWLKIVIDARIVYVLASDDAALKKLDSLESMQYGGIYVNDSTKGDRHHGIKAGTEHSGHLS